MSKGDQRATMVAFVERMNALIGAHPAELEDFLADDVVFTHWRWRGGEIIGKEKVIKDYFEELLKSFDDVDFVILDAIYGENKLVVRGEFNATFARDWGSLKANGKRVSYFAHDIYEFRDGKVVRAWFANDTLRAARQLGAVGDDGVVVGFNSVAAAR